MCQAGILLLPEALTVLNMHMLRVKVIVHNGQCVCPHPLGKNIADNINFPEVGKTATSRIHPSQTFLPNLSIPSLDRQTQVINEMISNNTGRAMGAVNIHLSCTTGYPNCFCILVKTPFS